MAEHRPVLELGHVLEVQPLVDVPALPHNPRLHVLPACSASSPSGTCSGGRRSKDAQACSSIASARLTHARLGVPRGRRPGRSTPGAATLVNSPMWSLASSAATRWLMNSEPLSARNPRTVTGGRVRASKCTRRQRRASGPRREGRAILDALIEGEEDPEACGAAIRAPGPRERGLLAETVPGLIRDRHRFLLRDLLDAIDHLSRRIGDVTRPFSAALALRQTMPGVRPLSARAILAEIGDDMTRFPTARHFASWARVRPGNRESAGKRRPDVDGEGQRAWMRDALSQVAWGPPFTRTSGRPTSEDATRHAGCTAWSESSKSSAHRSRCRRRSHSGAGRRAPPPSGRPV